MVKSKIDLVCSQEQFEEIHAALDKVSKNAKVVSISKQALTNLLIDHTTLLQETNQ